MTINRPAFFASAASLSMSVAARAGAADLTRWRVSVIPIIDTAPFYAAQQQGYFTDAGLDVTTTSETTGAVGIPALVAGAFDVVYSNIPSVLQAIQQGLDLRFISQGETSGPPDSAVLLARKGDGFTSGRDLHGKLVACNGLKNLQWIFARAWIKATGGDPDQVNFRDVPLPQMGDALKNKSVDVVFGIEPFVSALLTDPTIVVLGTPFSKVMPGARPAAWVATGETALKRTEPLRAYLRAYARGVKWVNDNLGKEPVYKLMSGYTRLDEARLMAMKLPHAMTDVDVRQLKRMAALMAENGLPVPNVDIDAHVFR